jgi:hypothetical protein
MPNGRQAVPTEREIEGAPERARPVRRHRLVALWFVVSAFWTAATILRVDEAWVPILGWWRILDGPWLWLTLILPPLMFAAILAAIHLIKAGPRK